MKKIFILLLSLVPVTLAIAQQTGPALLEAAITYHDPQGQWPGLQATFVFSDSRPGQPDRQARMHLDNVQGNLCVMRQQAGHRVMRHVTGNTCRQEVDDRPPTAAEKEELQLTDSRCLMLRNYYLYLWGLPMKLHDPGTHISDSIYHKPFNGKETLAIRVTYDKEVGSDIWYFYFDPHSHAMVGYQFFHDESKGDGEYIVLAGEQQINGLRIPAQRTWYTNADSTLLGTDRLVEVLPLKHRH